MNSSTTLTALDVDYSSCADMLLTHANHSVATSDAPLNIAILAKDYLAHLPHLYALWQRQTRPWHIMVVENAYETSAQRLTRYSGKIFNLLESQWPLALPGLHRMDIQDYRFSINVLFTHDKQGWKQFCASVHWFIVDGEIYPEALRMGVPNLCIMGMLDKADNIVKQLQSSQFQIIQPCQKGVERGVWQAQSRRPQVTAAAHQGRNAIVIGAGVAGAGVAFALAQRGWRVKVLDPIFTTNIPDSEAYRYASGAVTPLLTVDDDYKARLSRAGVLRARARWCRDIVQHAGIHQCGTLELDRDKGHAKDLIEVVRQLQFPQEWVGLVGAGEASQLAGIAVQQQGAFFPLAMQIPPVRLAYTLLQHEYIECIAMRVHHICSVEKGFTVHGSVLQMGEDYDIYAQDNTSATTELKAPVVIVATAMNSLSLLQASGLDKKTLKSGQQVSALGRLESLHPLAGEVMMIPQHKVNGGPRCVIGGQGYYLPRQEGFCVMGSTYLHGELHPEISKVGQQTIWRKMPMSLPVTLEELQESGQLKGRACVRAVVQGRLPVIAELSHLPGLWVVGAYASHGMTWSSLAGDIVGASLEGEPIPLEKDLLSAISLKA